MDSPFQENYTETDEFWNVIDLLKENGAQGILICPIDKMFV